MIERAIVLAAGFGKRVLPLKGKNSFSKACG
jgi:choline kinase